MIEMIMLVLFIIGYLFISLEDKVGINKSATSLFLCVTLWSLYMMGAEEFVPRVNGAAFERFLSLNPDMALQSTAEQIRAFVSEKIMIPHVGDIAEIIFFLMGAMTIVEIIDRHGGFNFVNNRIKTRNSLKLLWIITFITFFLSAVLDNLTTAIVMIMVLRKLVSSQHRRWLFGGMVILAANAGGAFSPIGDVTTIMLWIKGNITSMSTISHLILPSIISVLIPLGILSFSLKGEVEVNEEELKSDEDLHVGITPVERAIIFALGVGGLVLVPVFRSLTGLPPFVGILGVLAILWLYTEIIYRRKTQMEESIKNRVSKVIKHIDIPTILFFFGILMAVAALQEVGLLTAFADYLDKNLHDVYLISGLIGFLSAIVDNVPLVAGAIGMYPVTGVAEMSTLAEGAFAANFAIDGPFWQLLAYCAGVGGSILIIGSAAGVVVMGLEKIEFGWYLKRISLLAVLGYLGGIGAYYLQSLLF